MGQQLCLRSKESITALAVVTAEGKGTTHKLLAVIKIYSLQVSWLEMSFPDVYITGFGDETLRRYWGLGGVMGPHDGKVASTRQRDLSQCTGPVSQQDTVCYVSGIQEDPHLGLSSLWKNEPRKHCFFRVAHSRCLVVL